MKRGLFASTLIAAIIVVVVLFSTNPHQSGPIGILAFFVALYIALLGVIAFVLYGVSCGLARVAPKFWTRRPIESVSLLHSYYYASVLALAPILLVGIGSVGKIDIGEIALVVIFVTAATIYVRRMVASA